MANLITRLTRTFSISLNAMKYIKSVSQTALLYKPDAMVNLMT